MAHAAVRALLLALLVFLTPVSTAQSATSPVPEPLTGAFTEYARGVDELVERAQEREDPSLDRYVNASERVHELLELGFGRSAALITADALGRELSFSIMRESQFHADPPAYIRVNTSERVQAAQARLANASQLIAYHHGTGQELMASTYAAQVMAMAQSFVSNHPTLRHGQGSPSQLASNAARAVTFTDLFGGVAQAASEVTDGRPIPSSRLEAGLAERIDQLEPPSALSLDGNRQVTHQALEQGAIPIALAHYLQMESLVQRHRLLQEALGEGSLNGTADRLLARANETLATSTAVEEIERLGYPSYLVEEAQAELRVAINGTPGVPYRTSAHAEDVAQALGRVEGAQALVDLLEDAPAAQENPIPLPGAEALLAALGALALLGRRRPRIPSVKRLVPLLVCLGLLTWGLPIAGAQASVPSPEQVEGIPGEPASLHVLQAPDGSLHVLANSFHEGGSNLYHGLLDLEARQVTQVQQIDRMRWAFTPAGIVLPDGSLQLVWWEGDLDAAPIQADDHTRPVTARITDGQLGPLQVINETWQVVGATHLALDAADRPALFTVDRDTPHIYRLEDAVWRDHPAPVLREPIGNVFMTDLHRVGDALVAGWLERGTPADPQRGVLMRFEEDAWVDRRELPNETSALAIGGPTEDPWVFFVAPKLDARQNPLTGTRSEVYGLPYTSVGADYPLNISRSGGASERWELAATEAGGKPLIIYEQGSDSRGGLLASWGPPFPPGKGVGAWTLPDDQRWSINGVTSLGEDRFLITGNTINISSEAIRSGNPPRDILLLESELPTAHDRQPPRVVPLAPAPGSIHKDITEVRALVVDDLGFDPSTLRVHLDERDLTPQAEVSHSGFQIQVPGVAEGLHTVRVEVADLAGNLTTRSWNFTADRTPPTVELSLDPDPGDAWSPVPVTATLTVTDEPSGVAVARYSRTNFSFPVYEEPVPLAKDGVNKLWYFAIDAAGNRGPLEYREVRVDTTAPVIDLTLPRFAPRTAMLAWNVTDPESGVRTVGWSPVEEGVWTNLQEVDPMGSTQLDVPIPLGRFGVRATNHAGLEAGEVLPVARDTVAPSLSVGALPEAAGAVQIQVADDLGNVSVSTRVDNGTWITAEGPPFTFHHDPGEHPPGSHTLTVRAQDEAGNKAWHNTTFEGTGTAAGEPARETPAVGLLSVLVTIAIFPLVRIRTGRREKP